MEGPTPPPTASPARRARYGNSAYPVSPELPAPDLSSPRTDDTKDYARVSALARDLKLKFENAVKVQGQMEEDIVDRDHRLELAGRELRELRKNKLSLETELSKRTNDFVEVQSKWLEQSAELNAEITRLKTQLTAQKPQAEAPRAATSPDRKDSGQLKVPPVRAKPPPAAPPASSDDLFVKELLARHEQYKEEVTQLRELNSRLQEENENFQVLLAEKTISRGLTLEDELDQDFADQSHEGPLDGTEQPEGTPTSQLQDDVNKLHFEVRSLKNHNRALRTSLERLVYRLLSDESFSRAVESSVPTGQITAFTDRFSLGERSASRPSVQSPTFKLGTPAHWTNMIFNTNYTGSASRRVISLGVDSVFPEDHPSASPGLLPQRRAASHVDGKDLFARIPNRTVSQTSLRKLRLTE